MELLVAVTQKREAKKKNVGRKDNAAEAKRTPFKLESP